MGRSPVHGKCHEEDLKTLRGFILTDLQCPLADFSGPPWNEAVLVTLRHAVRMKWNSMKHSPKHEDWKVCSRKTTIIKPWNPKDPGFSQHPNPSRALFPLLLTIYKTHTLYNPIMSSGRPPPSTTPVPPKASQTRGPSTRKQSANSISPAIGRTTENMLRHPAFEGHNASDEPSARKLLVEHGLLPLNSDPSHSQICNTLLCLTFATGVNAQVTDVIRATALLVESLSPSSPTTAEATPSVLAPMQQKIDRLATIVDEIKAATDSNSKVATTIAELAESTKKELESTSLNVSRTADAHASNLASSPSPPSAISPQKASYADIARHSTHARATALCESQTRTVHITPSQDSAPSWEDLTEIVLVEKANKALDLARTSTEDIPTDAKFLSARKSKSGSILYEVNTEEAAAWLRSPEGRVLFTANFGPDVSLETHPFSIIAEYVPVGTKTDDPQALRTIESTNSLPAGSIRSMRWIKPIERRTPN